MTAEQQEPSEMRLEALIIRDDVGGLYEVPCLVVERYRVSEERATELTNGLGGEGTASGDRWAEDDFAPWAVRGGVYSPASDAASSPTGQFPDLEQLVRAFVPTRRSPIPRCVVQR